MLADIDAEPFTLIEDYACPIVFNQRSQLIGIEAMLTAHTSRSTTVSYNSAHLV